MFIVPLRSGSGVRVKIFNAMAMGLPIVSTSIGAEGLDVVSGEHLLIADDPREFAGGRDAPAQTPRRGRRTRPECKSSSYAAAMHGRSSASACSGCTDEPSMGVAV